MIVDRYNPINLFEKASKLKLEIQAINELYRPAISGVPSATRLQ